MYQEFTTIGSSWRYYNIVFDRGMILWIIDQGLRTALIDLSIRLVKDEIIFFVSLFIFLINVGCAVHNGYGTHTDYRAQPFLPRTLSDTMTTFTTHLRVPSIVRNSRVRSRNLRKHHIGLK